MDQQGRPRHRRHHELHLAQGSHLVHRHRATRPHQGPGAGSPLLGGDLQHGHRYRYQPVDHFQGSCHPAPGPGNQGMVLPGLRPTREQSGAHSRGFCRLPGHAGQGDHRGRTGENYYLRRRGDA
ncbi:MAG: hypothetical protein GWP63_11180 [Haliea sp.]|nr:hypothetical protein [Haliea sp.]